MFYVIDDATGTVLRFGSGRQIVQEGERLMEASDYLDPRSVILVEGELREHHNGGSDD